MKEVKKAKIESSSTVLLVSDFENELIVRRMFRL